MAGKAKNAPEAHFPEGGGSGVRDMALPWMENLGSEFSETSFAHLKTYFT